jgi:hypothetical protein
MIDNTHVVVLRGSGRDMVPVPEMAAFGERFGFQFVAHAIGNANRSARVERPFWFIETNFLAGRTFRSWEDLNQRAREWCDKVNATYKKHIRAVPRELFAVERLHLKPLPAWIPEVYRLQQRLVDIEGYVALNSNRYSVPVDWIGRRVEVRETGSGTAACCFFLDGFVRCDSVGCTRPGRVRVGPRQKESTLTSTPV